MSGVALLEHGNFRRPTIKGIAEVNPDNGELQTRASLRASIEGRVRVSGFVKVTRVRGSDGAILTEPAKNVAQLANEATKLSRALIYYGGEQPSTFEGLFKVLDAIGQDVMSRSKLIKEGYVTENELDAFNAPANRQRHGHEGGGRAPKKSTRESPEMTLEEAKSLIRRILLALKKKLEAGE